jgi:hypothetical protein
VGEKFSAPVQTGPGAHPASYALGTGSFQEVKRPGRGVDHPPSSSAEVKGRWDFVTCFRVNVTFTCTLPFALPVYVSQCDTWALERNGEDKISIAEMKEEFGPEGMKLL